MRAQFILEIFPFLFSEEKFERRYREAIIRHNNRYMLAGSLPWQKKVQNADLVPFASEVFSHPGEVLEKHGVKLQACIVSLN